MAESSDPAVLYVAVYGDLDSARADLDALEQLHQAEMIVVGKPTLEQGFEKA